MNYLIDAVIYKNNIYAICYDRLCVYTLDFKLIKDKCLFNENFHCIYVYKDLIYIKYLLYPIIYVYDLNLNKIKILKVFKKYKTKIFKNNNSEYKRFIIHNDIIYVSCADNYCTYLYDLNGNYINELPGYSKFVCAYDNNIIYTLRDVHIYNTIINTDQTINIQFNHTDYIPYVKKTGEIIYFSYSKIKVFDFLIFKYEREYNHIKKILEDDNGNAYIINDTGSNMNIIKIE